MKSNYPIARTNRGVDGMGARLTLAMKRRGMSRQDVAVLLGTCEGSVRHWQSGLRTPSIAMLRRICRLLGCSSDWLLNTWDVSAAPKP